MSDSTADKVLIGKVVGVSGLQGWVKLESYTDPRVAIFDYQPWLMSYPDGVREVTVIDGREQGKGIVAWLPGCDSRESAQLLNGIEIHVERSKLPKPRAGEYYWIDLEGLAVRTVDQQPLGTVSHLFATGGNDVMVVRGERERLIPFVQGSVVTRVDLETRLIEVDWDPDF